jgi:membrane associated rhomboid family serine protease
MAPSENKFSWTVDEALKPVAQFVELQEYRDRLAIGGASGAISLLVGASVILQPNARIVMLFFRRIPVRVPMLLFGVFQVGFQAVMALLNFPGVGWYGHLSGLLIRLGFAYGARHQSGALKPFFQPGAA